MKEIHKETVQPHKENFRLPSEEDYEILPKTFLGFSGF
jgi:hypothetical protein